MGDLGDFGPFGGNEDENLLKNRANPELGLDSSRGSGGGTPTGDTSGSLCTEELKLDWRDDGAESVECCERFESSPLAALTALSDDNTRPN